MTATRFGLSLLVIALLAWTAGPTLSARAQDKPKDDALDQLLKKLDDPPRPAESPAGDAKPAPGQVKPEDKDLDQLLKKLGETEEEAAPSGKPPADGPATRDKEPEPKPPGDAKPDDLKDKDKALDEHLRELLGRKAKPKDQQGGGGGGDESDGPLSDAIKKMLEVRERLVKSDTGEGTRKTEGEVVKELDTLLQKIRQAQAQGSGSKSGKKLMSIQQAGNQGQKPGNQQNPNPNGKGVGAQQPKKPKLDQVLAGTKDTWGDLPPSLREEMENIFKEDMLPAKRDLIIRYYTSVSKKGRSSGAQE